MNEFLKKLRSNTDKRYDRNRRPYNGPGYRNMDAKTNKNGRKHPHSKSDSDQLATLLSDWIPAIKDILEEMNQNQKRIAQSEETKVEVLQEIAYHLKHISSAFPQSSPSVKSDIEPSDVSDVSGEAAEEDQEEQEEESEEDSYSEEDALEAERQKIISLINGMREQGSTYGQIAAYLCAENVPTFSGKGRWHAQTVHRVLQPKNM